MWFIMMSMMYDLLIKLHTNNKMQNDIIVFFNLIADANFQEDHVKHINVVVESR